MRFRMRGSGNNTVWKMKLIKLIFILFICFSGFSQPLGKDSNLVSRQRPGLFWFVTGWRPAKIEKLRKFDRLIIDVTYNQLLTKPTMHQNPFRSIGCNVNTMWDVPMTKGNTVSFGIGLAYKFQKFAPKGLFYEMNGSTQFNNDTTYLNYKKNTFSNHILALPIEFRFRTPGWKHFKVHLGASVGYRLKSVQKLWQKNSKSVIRTPQFPDNNGLVLGAHMRIGIRNWALFADYTFVPQFYKKASVQTSAISFGISLSLF